MMPTTGAGLDRLVHGFLLSEAVLLSPRTSKHRWRLFLQWAGEAESKEKILFALDRSASRHRDGRMSPIPDVGAYAGGTV